MKRPSGKKPARPLLPVYLAYLLLFSLLLTGVSFSYYVSTSSSGAGAQVAGGILTVKDVSSSDSRTLTLGPDAGSASWTFQVSNSNGTEVSQVSLQYDVILELGKPLPDGVTVQLDGTAGQPDNSLWGWFSGGTDSTTYRFESAGSFKAGTSASKEHTLSFSGGVPDKSEDISFTITVLAEQID